MSLDRVCSSSSTSFYLMGGVVSLLALGVAYRIYNRYQKGALNREFRDLSNLSPESVIERVNEIRKRFTLDPDMNFEFSLKGLASFIDMKKTDDGIGYAQSMEAQLANPHIEDVPRSVFFFYQSILERQKDRRNAAKPVELLTKALQYSIPDIFRAKLLADRAFGYYLQKDQTNAEADAKRALKLTSDPALKLNCYSILIRYEKNEEYRKITSKIWKEMPDVDKTEGVRCLYERICEDLRKSNAV